MCANFHAKIIIFTGIMAEAIFGARYQENYTLLLKNWDLC